jgi:hypothetical protein
MKRSVIGFVRGNGGGRHSQSARSGANGARHRSWRFLHVLSLVICVAVCQNQDYAVTARPQHQISPSRQFYCPRYGAAFLDLSVKNKALARITTKPVLVGVPSTSSGTSLFARYAPKLLPPPPPPPSDEFDLSILTEAKSKLEHILASLKTALESLDGDKILAEIDQWLQDFQKALENMGYDQLALPRLPDLSLSQISFPPLETDALSASFTSVLERIVAWVASMQDKITAVDEELLGKLRQVLAVLNNDYIAKYPEIQQALNQISAAIVSTEQLALAQHPSPTVLLVSSAVVTYAVVSSVLTWGQPPPASKPYPLDKYDPIAARAYFDRRLPQVVGRSLFVVLQSLQFGMSLLRDKLK